MGEVSQQTFRDHLNELKKRSFLVFINFLLGTVAGFLAHKQIEALLQRPLGQTLYYSNPAGGLSFVMQIAISVGLIVSLPLFLYEVVQFIRPSLKPIKARYIALMIFLVLSLSVMAVLYVYFVSLPSALKFLVSFNSSSIQALINVNDYARFILAYMGGAILAFQLPLMLFFMNKIRRFPPGGLTKMQGPVIVGSIVVGGVLTPTVDPINQLLLAGPIILLFELSVVSIWLSNRKHHRNAARLPVVKIAKPRAKIANQPKAFANSFDMVSGSVKSPNITVTSQKRPSITQPMQHVTPGRHMIMDILPQSKMV